MEKVYADRFSEVEADLARRGPGWLHERRRSALDSFRERGFPTARDEEWKNTDVRSIVSTEFTAPPSPAAIHELDADGLAEIAGTRIVFVNGEYAPSLASTGDRAGGVHVSSLSNLNEEAARALEPHLAKIAPVGDRAFAAWNTAFASDGAAIVVPANTVLDEPIHVIFVAVPGSKPHVAHPRTVVVVGAGSEATVIESYLGKEGVYLTNAVTEMRLGENARVEHCRVQLESRDAFHVATIQAHQERDSRLLTHSVSAGAGLSRHDTGSVLDGEGADCFLNGIYLTDGKRSVDHHTALDHAKPHCTSHEIYKGILSGNSRAVFNGRIIVREDAQKTDAKQSNRNLLLSKEATVHTRPQLEIYANDVKCTHGATIGRLDESAMFYLRSRGIGRDRARDMLIHAFAGEVLDRIRHEPLRERLRSLLDARLPGQESG